MAIQEIQENDYIKDSREVINNNFTELDTLKAPLASPALTGTPTAPTPSPGDDSAKVATTEYVREEIRQHANMPIGFEYFTINPNIPQGSLPLFGGEYSRATYSDLWAWVQTQTGYLKTEAQWQALSTSNAGNVPYYSDGDGSTTFRVPSLKCWIKSANGTVSEVGSYLAAGLPNITGGFGVGIPASNGAANPAAIRYPFGAFSNGDAPTTASGYFIPNGSITPLNPSSTVFSASNSNSIYGKSTTVQPPSIVGMWLVKAYGTIEDTGSIDEQAYIDDRFTAAKDYAKQYTDTEVSTGVPTGVVQAFAGSNTPTGWLLCDGSAVSRTTYAALFSAIGTKYGSGNGSSTFNVPNLIDKFVQGNATSGTVKSAGLPNIKSEPPMDGTGLNVWTGGALTQERGAISANQTTYKPSGSGSFGTFLAISFDASKSNAIYGNSTTVQPPAVTMRYIIKY